MFSDVIVGRDPAEVGQRFVMYVDDPAVAQFDNGVEGFIGGGDTVAPFEIFSLRHLGHAARGKSEIDDFTKRHSGSDGFRRNAVDLRVAFVGDD